MNRSARKRLWRDKEEEPSPSSEEHQHLQGEEKEPAKEAREAWSVRSEKSQEKQNFHGNQERRVFQEEEMVNIPPRYQEYKQDEGRERPLDLVTWRSSVILTKSSAINWYGQRLEQVEERIGSEDMETMCIDSSFETYG